MIHDRPRLVLLGSGFASFSLLKAIDTNLYDVHVVSPRNHFLFTPLLPSTTVGTTEFRSIIEPIRTARKDIHSYQAHCVAVDPEKHEVECRGAFKDSPFTLPYDVLVIGVGAVNNTFGVPGVAEHALFLKELADARVIRQKVIECFERGCKPGRPLEELQALLHFVVVGGGPTGVEFAAELHDFVTEDLARWFPDLMQHTQITLIEGQDKILTTFDARLSAYAQRQLQRGSVKVRTNTSVKEVRENCVVLKDDSEIHCSMIVWSTGIAPTDFVRALPFAKDERSRIVTDEFLRVEDVNDIYAAGDCARIRNVEYPATAQVAQQSGKYLGRTLNRMTRQKPAKPFRYRHMGMLAYVGDRKALADLKGVKGRGFTTWIFWRSAYLTKLVSLKNKILVAGDWIRTFFFGRDISRF